MPTIKKYYCIILGFTFLFSCSKKKEINHSNTKSETLVKYAKGFELEEFTDYFILTINKSYKDSKTPYKYTLVKSRHKFDTSQKNSEFIKIPVKRVIATSTTHIPMIEALGEEKSLVGFPNTKYISSLKTRKLIDRGIVHEVGVDADLNTEIILDLNPDIVVGFSVSAKNKSLEAIKRMGISILYNGAWLEETPLGRAEWLKFFGVLYDKKELADSIFNDIERKYLSIKASASEISNKPTILSGALFKDVWNMPAGDSFVSQFFRDANTHYLWRNTAGTGSLQLNFESVLDAGQEADLWIGPGSYTSKESLIASNPHYANFKTFKTGEIYTFSKRKGNTGGTIYYELGALRPDLILKDIVKIAHPELLTDQEFTFFDKVD